MEVATYNWSRKSSSNFSLEVPLVRGDKSPRFFFRDAALAWKLLQTSRYNIKKWIFP